MRCASVRWKTLTVFWEISASRDPGLSLEDAKPVWLDVQSENERLRCTVDI